MLLDQDHDTPGEMRVIKQPDTCPYPQNLVKSTIQNDLAVVSNGNTTSLEEARNLAK